MTRLIMLIFGLGTSLSAVAEGNICLNIFTFKTLQDRFLYTNLYNIQNNRSLTGEPSGQGVVIGRATLVGKEANLQARPLAELDYSIKGNFLTIASARIPSELNGDGIYSQLLKKVLADNPNVNIIMTSLTGKFYEEYLVNLEFVQGNTEVLSPSKTDSDVAVELGSVFAELNKLGFSHVRSSTIIENFSGPFVRFSVTR